MDCELTNFTVWGRDWFDDGWEGLRRFCAHHGLAGVELLASGVTPQSAPPAELIEGVHLRSLGSWLPLAGLDVPDVSAGAPRYQEATSYGELVRLRAEELRTVAQFEPWYAVWHATYGLAEAAREQSGLGTAEFLPRLAALVRDVVAEFRPPFTLCFENAYGASLDPADPSGVAEFLAALGGLPAAFCLDIGHHLNRHRELSNPEAACRELRRLAEGLRGAGVETHVLHLHWTPPELVTVDGGPGVEEDPGDYFARSDQHHPLSHPLLGEAVGALAPAVVVHEMGAMSLHDHDAWLTAQTAAMRGQ
jgi:hypothetical protein